MGSPRGDTDGPLGEWCTGQDEDFSFFITSMDALWILSDSTPGDMNGGFGGDFGGLEGADDICQTIAAATGFGHLTWHALLSATDDGAGNQVHAIERIGTGPWYDANGRLVATGIDGLLADDRPDGDARTVDDLPDECGVPLSLLGDSHDIITGSNQQGRLDSSDQNSTCDDWTSTTSGVTSHPGDGAVMCGHSFPRSSSGGPPGPGGDGANWISDHGVAGCAPGAVIVQGRPGGDCIGCNGGYGALYCFAL